MNKKNELDLLATELKHCVETLIGVSESLSKVLSDNDVSETTDNVTDKPVVPERPAITLEEVRAVLARKSRAGFTAEVRALLVSHGAEKLSEIDPSKYSSLLQEAEVLGNG